MRLKSKHITVSTAPTITVGTVTDAAVSFDTKKLSTVDAASIFEISAKYPERSCSCASFSGRMCVYFTMFSLE